MSKKASIIGSGFAALSAARRLRRLDAGVRISLIAPRRELIYLPSLIWLPSGKRKPEDLVVPLISGAVSMCCSRTLTSCGATTRCPTYRRTLPRRPTCR